MNDIVENDEGYFYWDEDMLIGPFKTKEQAEVAYTAALKWSAKDHRKEARKIKIEDY
jgi:hypothetical protein